MFRRPARLLPASPEAARSTAARLSRRARPPLPMRAQRGVVLFFALIVLVILLIGGIAVVRMSNASLLGAGNLAFRRDLTGQSDAAIAKAVQVLNTIGNKSVSDPSKNYSAVILDSTGTQGLPKALFGNDPNFTGRAPALQGPANSQVTMTYIIERMCGVEGASPNPTDCLQPAGNTSNGGSHLHYIPPPQRPNNVIYRLSVRVTGPRGTEAFFQSTFSGP